MGIENFKIIAIKTGSIKPTKVGRGHNSRLLDPLRNLASNKLFIFRNEYEFVKNETSEITYKERKDIDLLQLKTSINSIPTNINAIVGSNGSGKSTLIELLYWANYNIGSALNILEDNNNQSPYKFLDFELIYSTNKGAVIKIVFKEGKILRQGYKRIKSRFTYDGEPQEIKHIEELSDFFYTIVINYSHYALNSEEIGDWIISLFHKNDGYQTPIVLNPMRNKGGIDINKEKHLLTRRLVANVLEFVREGQEENSLRNIVNGKIASYLKVSYNPNPNASLEEPIDPEIRTKLITAFEQYFKFQISEQQLDDDFFVNVTLSYIHKKLIKMVDYKMFKRYKDHNSDVPAIKNINAFIKRIHESNSHISFKVKGAILYLKYYSVLLPNLDFKKSFNLSVSELSKKIKDINESESFMVNTFMMAPPSYFHVNIVPKDETQFDALSSGEKQKIHSISSIVYHLINLNSVEQLKDELKKNQPESDKLIHYNYINIVLDEIELYYHPDWQRTYIADLLDYIGKINPENLRYIKGLNITFLTHSPYILSDIPETFVLKLYKGSPEFPQKGESTFGANIYDLLANEFFMQNGFMGEWAKRQIEETIKYLNLKQCEKEIKDLTHKTKLSDEEQAHLNLLTKEREELSKQEFRKDFRYYEKIIDLIGEPVIKNKIKTMYSDLLEDDERKQIAKKQILRIAKEVGLKIDLN